MSAASPDTTDLEEAGFVVEGLAQTLYAMSTSEACRDMSMALDLLAKAADSALETIKAHVAASCTGTPAVRALEGGA